MSNGRDRFLKDILFLNGMAKVIMKTYGCSNNVAESEMMAGLISKAGHFVVESEEYAKGDVVLFNMCSVKGPSVNHCLNEIKKIKAKDSGKKIIVAGCVPLQLIPDIKSISEDICIVNTHHIDKITQAVESNGTTLDLKEFARPIKLNMPRVRKNKVVSIVPILQGCNDYCTYCSTKLVKGNTFSYPEKMIVKEVMDSVRDGCREIWLTSQDNGAYMTDNGYVGLGKLLKQINAVKGEFYVRVGMANPTYLLECLSELIEAMKLDKVYKFIHIPVQSGNDSVLSAMKRRYTADQYMQIVFELKKEIPDITIATDVICGFPSETDAQFEDTLKLIKETKPDVVNISRFQARPGTRAFNMENVHGRDIKKRSRKITEVFEEISLSRNREWIGKECFILIDEIGKGGESIGRNLSYKQVIVKEKLDLGSIVKVKIVDGQRYCLIGNVLKGKL